MPSWFRDEWESRFARHTAVEWIGFPRRAAGRGSAGTWRGPCDRTTLRRPGEHEAFRKHRHNLVPLSARAEPPGDDHRRRARCDSPIPGTPVLSFAGRAAQVHPAVRPDPKETTSMTRMTRTRCTLATMACIAVASAVAIRADVKTEQKAQVKFAGALGRMFNMFGGKAAKEGVVTKIAIKGDRMLSASGENGQLVDLAEEKVYELNFANSSYRVTTFDELRRRMREGEEEAREAQGQAEKREEKSGGQGGEKAPEYDVDVATKFTGATRTISGFDTRQA